MASTYEHNYELQQKGMFSAANLEENKQGRYSSAQLQRFQNERDFIVLLHENYASREDSAQYCKTCPE
jgi:hypothetical protein